MIFEQDGEVESAQRAIETLASRLELLVAEPRT